MKIHTLLLAALLFPFIGFAQVNSGSNGSDGALNPTSNLVINMADHPDGIYHFLEHAEEEENDQRCFASLNKTVGFGQPPSFFRPT